jgi:hypothetical protein
MVNNLWVIGYEMFTSVAMVSLAALVCVLKMMFIKFKNHQHHHQQHHPHHYYYSYYYCYLSGLYHEAETSQTWHTQHQIVR